MTAVTESPKTTARFYHLEHGSPLDVLPALVSKGWQAGHNILIVCEDETQLKSVDQHLWDFAPESFLPHVEVSSKYAAQTPICLTTSLPETIPNSAQMLVVLNSADYAETVPCTMICHLFEAAPQPLAHARNHWKLRKRQNAECTYWQQDHHGRWQQTS